jgi:hypothetical protein
MAMKHHNSETAQAHEDLSFESVRIIERQYADIFATLGRAASLAGSHSAATVLAESARSMRRIAAGLPAEYLRGVCVGTLLYRLTYVSFAVERQHERLLQQAAEISHCSEERNAHDGITGALAVGSGWFAQVLEGPVHALIPCFDRILSDPRHADARVLSFEPTDLRQFADWSMACPGEIAPNLVRQAVIDYAKQEQSGCRSAPESARALAGAIASNIATRFPAGD